ncbi:MAG: ADP-ribosyltransferase [Treponema sp.]|nr:ADP-ribosyltransferase [Treponema sp.]
MIKTLLYRIKGKFQNIGANWDKLAPSKEQAIDYAHTHINQEPQRMIDVHHFSLEYCLAHSSESVNKHYRQNRQDDIDLQIGDMVSQHTTDTDLVLYRGVCDYVYDLMKENAKNMPDCDLYEKGFLACSLVKGHEINPKTKLRIYVPAGTKCVYMGNVNEEQGFYEVDVMHGSKLKIISIDDEYINCQLLATV